MCHIEPDDRIAEVRASIPGRIRLYMPAVTANPEAAAQMKRQMEETGAVHEVQINPSVGTVLFLYDERQVEAGEPGTAEA